MIYSVKLEDFEGPLDLLLHLIRQNKINILDIPIAEITRQYTSIIDNWEFFDMSEACDYLDMATRLMKIKSQLILPRAKVELEEEEDPRKELARQLELYALFQEALKEFKPEVEVNLLSYEKDPEYHKEFTIEKPNKINIKKLARIIHRIILSNEDISSNAISIKPEKYSIESIKRFIIDQLKRNQKLKFDQLIRDHNIEEVITVFLACLELYKVGVLQFKQMGKEIKLYASGFQTD